VVPPLVEAKASRVQSAVEIPARAGKC